MTRKSSDVLREAERLAHVRRFFDQLQKKFLALPSGSENGSFTVHFQARRPRTVEWLNRDNVDAWEDRESA